MKTNAPVLMMNRDAFFKEVQQLLKDQKREILMELNNNSNKDIFTRKELARYLRCSTQTIINWSANGIIKPTYIGNRVYYKADEVNKLLNR